MKIRIKGNSIRLRLSKTEVDTFGNEGLIEDATEFANGAFVYAMAKDATVAHLSATWDNGKITILVPEAIAEEWTGTDTVGYEHDMETGAGKSLFLLIEKDFKCIDADVREDQSDNYEHPTHTCG